MRDKPEILAPAGSREAFFAALSAGADAVYLAGERFGARAYAANFSLAELAGLMEYAHLRGAAVYVAVNTLLNDEELPQAVEFCRRAYLAGADALIVQDIGLTARLGELYPQIPLNASTQMTLHNSAGVRFMEGFGFRRVILAREVSLADIRAICAQTEQEIEVFAHGALCICFSGQCLFSSMVGGRSGNRGRCAQPCRLKYQLINAGGEVLGSAHLLSPRDLNTIDLLPQLQEAGVVSLKIEGRMKRPEYVAQVSAAYAAARRGEPYDERALRQAFNRGFTSAYLVDEPGADMMSYDRPNNRGTMLGRISRLSADSLTIKLDAPLAVGDGLEIWVSRGGRQGFIVPESAQIDAASARIPLRGLPVEAQNCRVGDRVFKTLDSRLLLPPGLTAPQDDLPLRLHFAARLGSRPLLKAVHDEYEVEAEGDYLVEKANNHPADTALLQKQLGRLGGSGWYLAELSAEMDEGLLLPASVLNNLRREAVALLERQMLAKWQRDLPEKPWPENPQPKHKQRGKAVLAAAVDSLPAAEAAVRAGADELYWQACRGRFDKQPTADELARLAVLGVPVFAKLPTIALEDELPLWRRRLAMYCEAGFAGVLAANPWALQLLAEQGAWGGWLADFGFNCFNAAAAEKLAGLGAARVALSGELNAGQLAEVAGRLAGSVATEVQVFGNIELMTSRHCPIGAVCGGKTAAAPCTGACRGGGYKLRDEKGFCFPVYTDEFCRSHIYNGYQLCLIDEAAALARQHAALRLDLLHYSSEQAAAIVALFRAAIDGREDAGARQKLAKLCGAELTKGHYFRGVE